MILSFRRVKPRPTWLAPACLPLCCIVAAALLGCCLSFGRVSVFKEVNALVNISDRLRAIHDSYSGPDIAWAYQRHFARELLKAGWSVVMEFPQRYERNDRTVRGRIDVVAFRSGESLAIELDRSSPRKKSIDKLQRCGFQNRFVVMRNKGDIVQVST